VAAINVGIAAGALSGLVKAYSATINSKACVVLADIAGDKSFSVLSTDFTAALKNILCPVDDDLLDTTVTSASTTVTLRDNGVFYAMQVDTVGNGLSNVLFDNAIGFDKTAASNLTEYLLEGASADGSFIDYTTGDLRFAWKGDPLNGTAATRVSYTMKFATTTAAVTYRPGWPHSMGPTKSDYSRVFHARACSVAVGDTLYNAGNILGRVVAIEAASVGTGSTTEFTGAQLRLGDATISTANVLTDWYLRAESLDQATRSILPEIVVSTTAGTVTAKHALNTGSNGIAMSGTAPMYTGYKALRLDVTPAAANPNMLVFANVDEVDAIIGPVSPDNPLAFGLSKAFENTTNVDINAVGVDDVTADAPQGTPEAYARAWELLETKEVYNIAPLTFDRMVARSLALHCTTLSLPENKLERAGLTCCLPPSEKEPTPVISGNMELAATGPNTYTFAFSDATKNVITALNGLKDANGNTLAVFPGATLTADQGVYVDRTGDAYRYLVTQVVDNNTVEIDLAYAYGPGYGPGSDGNDDVYYKEDASALSGYAATGEDCTIFVRQAAIDDTTTTGKNEQVDALAAYASGFGMSRFTVLQPAYFGTSIGGTETIVEGYYAAAAYAGMSSQNNPAQGFTNFPMLGFTRPIGSNDKFTEKQMATAAAGGINWIIQDTAGAEVFSRHQLTTNTLSLKTREWSVIRSVDYVAKLVRATVRRFIGKNNITKQLLEEISISLVGVGASVSGTVVAECNVSSVRASTTNPDQILVTVSLVTFYPANKIVITIVS
jgi:hypothetical protein